MNRLLVLESRIQLTENEQQFSDQQRIAILALTAHALPEYEARCMASGMNMMMSKPINIEALNRALKFYAKKPQKITNEH